MKYLAVFFSSLFLSVSIGQQTLLWDDDFETSSADWNITMQTGNNEADANVWKISDAEGGVAPPDCAEVNNGDNTLFIGCQGPSCVETRAVYNPGDGSSSVFVETNLRAAYTQPISTVGETDLEFVFDWIGVGENGVDYAEIEYSIDGGVTWNVFWTQTPGATCGTLEGEWAEETVALPAATENQADLRFAFHWRNNNVGTDGMPSFAVNNLRLFASNNDPTANFNASSTNICIGDSVDFFDTSSGTNLTNWSWNFEGGTPTTSNAQNPDGISFSSAGSFEVMLIVEGDNGTDTTTQTIDVTECTPVAYFTMDTMVICEGDCITFTDSSLNYPTNWEWTFEGGEPESSFQQNPPEVCFDSTGNYNISLVVGNSAGSDSTSLPISVLEPPSVYGYGDTIIDIGGAAEIWADHIDQGEFFWDPIDHLDCDTCLEVTATPYLTTVYYPSLTGPNGCTGRDTVQVVVNFEDVVDVPSAFSPNGDGYNDFIYVKGIGIVSIDFKVFNRYGQMVFSTKDIDEGWDGTHQGEELNQGVFVYTLEYDLIDGQSGEKSGNITLVK
ncbi:MAG: gliding motility-associated C-terminal domain-containing protein [Brumimicrobium sp.]